MRIMFIALFVSGCGLVNFGGDTKNKSSENSANKESVIVGSLSEDDCEDIRKSITTIFTSEVKASKRNCTQDTDCFIPGHVPFRVSKGESSRCSNECTDLGISQSEGSGFAYRMKNNNELQALCEKSHAGNCLATFDCPSGIAVCRAGVCVDKTAP